MELVLIAECYQIRASRIVRHVTDGAEHYDHRDAVGRRCLARYHPAGRGSHATPQCLQPNVLTLLVKGRSSISQVSQLKGKVVSVNAPNDIGTLLIDSLLVAHGLRPQQVHYANVPFPAVAPNLITPNSPVVASFAPEPFVSGGEAKVGLQELADLDQGATQDFPIQGYAVTAEWAKKYPNTLKAFTTALSQGQEIADTDRAAVEQVLQKYLQIDQQAAAFISLPAFPLGVDAVRLQRVVSSMKRFGLLPKSTNFQVTSMIAG